MKIYDLNLPEHFCPQPFTYMYAEHQGNWKPCCKVDVYPDKSSLSFDEWWYEDEDLDNLRSAMLDEKVSPLINDICTACRIPESQGIKSYRQHSVENFQNSDLSKSLAALIKAYKKTGQTFLPENERLFELKVRGFGNQCNLKCYMCFPPNSSSRINEMRKAQSESIKIFFKTNKDPHKKLEESRKKILDIDAEKSKVYDAIKSVSSNITRINLSGGEPVMIEEYYNLMDMFIKSGDAKDISVFMNSNLTKLGFKDKNILDYIDKFKKFDVYASVDDLYERDEWIRYPSKFDKVLENFKIFNEHPNVNIGVNVTWSILNIANAESIIKYLRDNNMNPTENLNFVDSPKELSVKNYPFKSELIEKYSKSNDVILNSLAKAMTADFNQEEFNKAIRYIKDLDKIRHTKSYEIFPELSQFLT